MGQEGPGQDLTPPDRGGTAKNEQDKVLFTEISQHMEHFGEI